MLFSHLLTALLSTGAVSRVLVHQNHDYHQQHTLLAEIKRLGLPAEEPYITTRKTTSELSKSRGPAIGHPQRGLVDGLPRGDGDNRLLRTIKQRPVLIRRAEGDPPKEIGDAITKGFDLGYDGWDCVIDRSQEYLSAGNAPETITDSLIRSWEKECLKQMRAKVPKLPTIELPYSTAEWEYRGYIWGKMTRICVATKIREYQETTGNIEAPPNAADLMGQWRKHCEQETAADTKTYVEWERRQSRSNKGGKGFGPTNRSTMQSSEKRPSWFSTVFSRLGFIINTVHGGSAGVNGRPSSNIGSSVGIPRTPIVP